MLAAACAAALAGVAVALVGTRPNRLPARGLPPDRDRGGRAVPTAMTGRVITGVVTGVERVGRAVRLTLGRRAAPRADRRAGGILVVIVAAVVLDAFLVAIVSCAALLTVRFRRLRRGRPQREAGAVERDLPELVDLLGLAVAAGHTFPAAVPLVERWAPPSLTPALGDLGRDLDAGRPAVEAVELLGERWGGAARPLILTLRSHLRDGTPLADALSRVGDDARLRRQRAAETRSRRLPVLMLFPLVLCTLPAFGVLTVAPIVAGTLRSLTGEQLEAAASNPIQEETPVCIPDSSSDSPTSWPESPAVCGGPGPLSAGGRSD